MTELKHFPLYSGATTVLLGCLIPTSDYLYAKYEEGRKMKTPDHEHKPLWERAGWSMPMRYIGGVVGFLWAASVSVFLCQTNKQRLTWTSQVQLYAVIALAALALWFLFDRTASGMAVSLVAGIGSWIGFMLFITP